MDLISYQAGLGFLHKFFLRSSSVPMGDAGERQVVSRYSDNQIIALGKYTQGMTEGGLQKVISRALSQYPSGGAPTTAEWATYFNEEAADIDYFSATAEGLKDTVVDGSKIVGAAAAVGGLGYLLWLGVPALLLLYNQRRA